MSRKRITAAAAATLLAVMTASAQNDMATAYFLDGYTYSHQLNPAFAGERAYIALPVIGNLGTSVCSNLGIGTFTKEAIDGKLVSIFENNVPVSPNDYRDLNKLMCSVGTTILGIGGWTGRYKSTYTTFDLSVRASIDASVPGEFISYAATGNPDRKDSYCFDRIGLSSQSYIEAAFGKSRELFSGFRLGGRVKLLSGIWNAAVSYDRLTIDKDQSSGDMSTWTAKGSGSMEYSLPERFGFGTKTGEDGKEYIDLSEFYSPYSGPDEGRYPWTNLFNSFGAAFDIGVLYEINDIFKVSASISDLGMMVWRNTVHASSDAAEWGFSNNGEMDAEDYEDIGKDDMEYLKDSFTGMMMFNSDDTKSSNDTRWLPATLRAGIEVRMPFWDRMSAGLLSTTKTNGMYTATELRASANIAPCNVFSFAASYAFGTYGSSVGAAINLHLPAFSFFAGLDNFLSMSHKTKDFIPLDSFGTTRVRVGMNIAFGQYRGRFQKAEY